MNQYDGISGKHALVTGAGRGIGRAAALHLADAGAQVIAVARSGDDLDTLKAETDGKIETWQEDVTKHAFYDRIERLTRLDILVNNAGMNRPLVMDEVDDDTLDAMLTLNVRQVYKTTQAALRVMRKSGGGTVVNMSSQMGHVGGPKRTVYCLTKFAIEGLTKALALEVADDKIRVNAVAPTFVITPMTAPMMEEPAFKELVMSSIPMGKVASVDDVAQAILFLASDAAAMITGTSLLVDGGWTAK
jgi:NAD(P)-dependent dehydrogenase (short-subunit alcohol dehydrogenase family)